MKLTLKDWALYRSAITVRAKTLLAEAQGVRWDRAAGRVAGAFGFVAGLSAYAGLLPARYAAPFAGVCAVGAALAPRAGRAAGILKLAYDQKRPFLPVLWDVAQVFANPTAIIAEAKTAALDAEAKQARTAAAAQAEQDKQKADAEKAALVEELAVKVKDELEKSGVFQRGQLSGDVPDALQQQPAPAATPREPLVAAMPIATGPALTQAATPEAEDQQAEDQQAGDQP